MSNKEQPITNISNEEFLNILVKLQEYHSIFYQLWTIGKPIFTEDIPTAAVEFNEDGTCVNFIFNPTFWQGLTEYQKLFTISHECLHIILNHGLRTVGKFSTIANFAADIVVNYSLVNNFGFTRKDVDSNNIYCWIDTLFSEKEQKQIKDNESFEYYYTMLNASEKAQGLSAQLVDVHDCFSNSSEIIKEIGDKLSNEEKEQIKDFIEKALENVPAGSGTGGLEYLVPKEKVKKKKKWETVIKKWSLKYLNDSTKDDEQWARVNRRFATLDNEFFLPTEMEIDEKEKDERKIEVWFFSDTSYSCARVRNRFFKAAESLPKDRFDVKMHCFDTSVYETTLESRKLYGFGGTSFSCIESYIQKYIKKNKCKYPIATFIITDGYGNRVHPEKPENWFWFLSSNYKSYIPKESKIYMLKEFE